MKFKKIMASMLCLAMFFTGCSNSDVNSANSQNTNLQTSSNATTITFWHYYGEYVESKLNLIVDDFNKTVGAENNIIVKTVAKPSIADLETELSQSAQGVVYAEEMPSMFLAYTDKILELQKEGLVCNLDEYLTQEEKDYIIDDFLYSGIINGEQVMMPLVKSTELIFINDTAWSQFCEETGFTDQDLSTFEGILEVAKEYYIYTDEKTPDIANDGKALMGFDSVQNFIIVSSMQKGVDMYNTLDGVAVIDEDVLKEIFEWYVEGVMLGYFANVGKFRTDDMRTGAIIAYSGSSASYGYIPDWVEVDGQKQDIEWKSLPYPYYEDANQYVLSQGAGVAVSKISNEQQEACVLFLNYLLKDNLDFAFDTAYIPVINEVLDMNNEEFENMLMGYNLQQQEIDTYNIVIDQIENEQLYQPMAFEGSYILRTEVANIFEQLASNLKDLASEKMLNGVSREEVLDEINLDEYVEILLNTIRESFNNYGLKYDFN